MILQSRVLRTVKVEIETNDDEHSYYWDGEDGADDDGADDDDNDDDDDDNDDEDEYSDIDSVAGQRLLQMFILMTTANNEQGRAG